MLITSHRRSPPVGLTIPAKRDGVAHAPGFQTLGPGSSSLQSHHGVRYATFRAGHAPERPAVLPSPRAALSAGAGWEAVGLGPWGTRRSRSASSCRLVFGRGDFAARAWLCRSSSLVTNHVLKESKRDATKSLRRSAYVCDESWASRRVSLLLPGTGLAVGR